MQGGTSKNETFAAPSSFFRLPHLGLWSGTLSMDPILLILSFTYSGLGGVRHITRLMPRAKHLQSSP